MIDVNEVVREMIVLLQGEAERHSIAVTTDLCGDIPQLMGDRVQLQQVNLIMNSIDAMKDADGTRELVVRSQRTEKDDVLVSVSDTGVGLSQQHASQIFNAFFTTKSHGTGLGLRISRSIVESHGGRLWAADNSPRGASFNFTLPTQVEAHECEKGGKYGYGCTNDRTDYADRHIEAPEEVRGRSFEPGRSGAGCNVDG